MIFYLFTFIIHLKVILLPHSMTTIADANDPWISYAGPRGWNGN